VEQHLGIVDAVLDGEIELAVGLFDNHLTESLLVVEERTAASDRPDGDALTIESGPS